MRHWKITSLTLLVGLFSFTPYAQSGHIERWSMDYLMLHSAGAIAANVNFATIAPEPEKVYSTKKEIKNIEVNLSQINTAYWNYEETIKDTIKILWPGTQRADDGNRITLPEHRGRIQDGSRYIFILAQNGWSKSPLSDGAVGIYEVDPKTKILKCDGGEIYSANEFGIICSTQDQQFAPPWTEEQLIKTLNQRNAIAKNRHNNNHQIGAWNHQPTN